MQSVEPGQTVTMNMYTMDGSELPLTGVVDSVSPEPSQNTGSQGSLTTFKAIITVDSIEGQAISSGMMVDYKIAVAESDSCLMVPTSAIVHTADGSTGVYTADSGRHGSTRRLSAGSGGNRRFRCEQYRNFLGHR